MFRACVAGVVRIEMIPYKERCYGRGICPAAWRAAQFGRASTYLDPQAEQRNRPYTSGNGVSAA